MADFSAIDYELADLERKAKAAGISIVSESGQLSESPERRKLKSEPSVAQLQAEFKRTMDNKKNDPMAAQKAVDLSKRITDRLKLEKQFDPSKYKGKVEELEQSLRRIEKKFHDELTALDVTATEGRQLTEENQKLARERQALVNEAQDLQSRRTRVETPAEAERWQGDDQRLGQKVKMFVLAQEKLKSKGETVMRRVSSGASVSRDLINRLKRRFGAMKQTLTKAREGV